MYIITPSDHICLGQKERTVKNANLKVLSFIKCFRQENKF